MHLNSHLNFELTQLKDAGRYRRLKSVANAQGPEIIVDGHKLLNFSSNNYLGLANDERLKKAAMDAIQRFGVGSGASRLITGSMALNDELEQALAEFKGVEAALVFNSGYQANIGLISSLMQEGDAIFSDSFNHASLIDGMRLTKAKTNIYRHLDLNHLESLLKQSSESKRRLIVTDTVFSMEGDLCPLDKIIALAESHDAWVLVDEAHATGVFGEQGRGVVEHFGLDPQHERLIQMGTLGKALGSFGAYVCGSQLLKDFLINKARSFIYTTALPPPILAASIETIKILREDASLKSRLWANTGMFRKKLGDLVKAIKETYICLPSEAPIIPLIIGENSDTMKLSDKLFENGLWAQGIRPPTVPEGTARIRFTLMASHTPQQIDRAINILKRSINDLRMDAL